MTGILGAIGNTPVVQLEKIAASGNAYWTNQLHDADSIKGYATIGQELVRQVDGPIHAFCGSVGTAGMLMGVSHALRGAGHEARITSRVSGSGSPLRFWRREPTTRPVAWRRQRAGR